MLSFKDKLIPLFLFIFTLATYVHNLARGIYGGDVADFVTSAIVMGIPHPSGYPLITLMGYFLTRFDFVTPAFMVGLISAVSSALAVTIFYFFSKTITKSAFISIISALVLAFSYLFWFHAEIAEVFALNSFFVVTLFFIAYLYYLRKENKYFYLLALFTGLSMTNNYIIAFLFPSLLMLLAANYKFFIKNPRVIVNGIFFGFLGLSVDFYILIAAQNNPPISWGEPKDLKGFIDVLLRKHYGTFGVGATPFITAYQKFIIMKNYLLTFIFQLTLPVLFLCLLGCIYYIRKQFLPIFSILVGFILSGPFFIFIIGLPHSGSFYLGVYERFYTMSSVIALFLLPFGIKALIEIVGTILRKNNYSNIILAILLIIPIFLFKYNFPKTDLSDFWMGEYLSRDYLDSLPRNSYLTLIGDTEIFNTWYVHYGLKVRPDVKLLGSVGDNNLEKEKNKFIKNNPDKAKNEDVVLLTLEHLAKKRPLFSNAQIKSTSGREVTWMPYGILYKLILSEKEIPNKEEFLNTQNKLWSDFKNKKFKGYSLSTNSLTINHIPEIYSNALIATGVFLDEHYNDEKLALKYYKKAMDIDKDNRKTYLALASYYTKINDCNNAIKSIDKAMSIYPLDQVSYFLLYYHYKICAKNNTKAENVIKTYESLFKGVFFNDLDDFIKKTK